MRLCRMYVVKYLFVYVWSYRVDKGPNAARKRAYSFCEFKECPPSTRRPLTPTSLTAAKVSTPGLRTRANALATP